MNENRSNYYEYCTRITKESAVDAIIVYLHRLNPSHPVLRSAAEAILDQITTQFTQSQP